MAYTGKYFPTCSFQCNNGHVSVASSTPLVQADTRRKRAAQYVKGHRKAVKDKALLSWPQHVARGQRKMDKNTAKETLSFLDVSLGVFLSNSFRRSPNRLMHFSAIKLTDQRRTQAPPPSHSLTLTHTHINTHNDTYTHTTTHTSTYTQTRQPLSLKLAQAFIVSACLACPSTTIAPFATSVHLRVI